MQKDLLQIKKKYGENMAHLCRSLFPTILENEGRLFHIISNTFEFNKSLYDDIVNNNLESEFKDYIYSFVSIFEQEIVTFKSPEVLLKEKGYTLYECRTVDDVNRFKKYYAPSELLCTFDSNRLDRCYIFFAVKDNVHKIKREDYSNPRRQDDYGVSVLSIQFTKGSFNTLSIKNRYNHTVNNPDATFSNNLDNIAPGLSLSFSKKYGLNINGYLNRFQIPGYVKANDGKYYKYNYEINGIYYCPNNIIIDNYYVNRNYQEKSRFLLVDYFILDMQEKKILLYDEKVNDSLISLIGNINSIQVLRNKKEKEVYINDDTVLKVNENNKIISFRNNKIKDIENNFLYYNDSINKIGIKSVKSIGDYFLMNNRSLTSITMPEVMNIGSNFLHFNKNLENIEVPKLKEIGNDFLCSNNNLTVISLPSIQKIGDSFLYMNEQLKKLYVPNLISVKNYFCVNNLDMENIEVPKLKEAGNNFFKENKNAYLLNTPQLERVENYFLNNNRKINKLYLPQIKNIGNYCMENNENLDMLYAPNIEKIGNYFNYHNLKLEKLDFPNLVFVGNGFLVRNKNLNQLNAPKLRIVGDMFLYNNQKLDSIKFPSLETCGRYFLASNSNIVFIDIPKIQNIGDFFLSNFNSCDIKRFVKHR